MEATIRNLETRIDSINQAIQKSTGLEQEKLNQEIANLRAELAGLNVRIDNSEKKLSEISNQKQKALVDREAISRVLFNLLDNAIKYSGENKKAFLRTWSDEKCVFLEVLDQGIGIGKEEQKRVFEKFYRSDNAHDSSIKGSGIGLTVVARIIEAQDGAAKAQPPDARRAGPNVDQPDSPGGDM